MPDTPGTPEAGAGTVLVLDDEPAILSVARRILEPEGYEVLTAGAAHEARQILLERDGPIDLLLCDLVLPGLGGREAANMLRARQPDLRVLFMSGYSSADSFRRELQVAGEAFMSKPFETTELVDAVKAAIEG